MLVKVALNTINHQPQPIQTTLLRTVIIVNHITGCNNTIHSSVKPPTPKDKMTVSEANGKITRWK
jgi:hypothetical protein